MKLHDLKDMDKDDFLGLIGCKPSGSLTSELLGTLGTFGHRPAGWRWRRAVCSRSKPGREFAPRHPHKKSALARARKALRRRGLQAPARRSRSTQSRQCRSLVNERQSEN